ncbi:hypothetical protein ACFCYM_29835 [Streptomyces sp. NPDC056254]|uniref:hypothetical protein n=1 Tax=Streptomyces sp. NPDC056254 TaxID=3345763 RepID=UPI0035D6F084
MLRTRAAVAGLPGGGAVPASVRESRREEAVADCLASTTTLWLPLYGAGAAVLVGAGAWCRDRSRAGRRPRAGSGPRVTALDAVPVRGPQPGRLRRGRTRSRAAASRSCRW